MKCKAPGNQRTAQGRGAQVMRRVLERSRRLAKRTALAKRMGLAKRRRLVTRKVLAPSRGLVKRKENTLIVQRNNVGYPGKDLTCTVLQSRTVKARAHRLPQGKMDQPVLMRLQSSLRSVRLDWVDLAWYGHPMAPLFLSPRWKAEPNLILPRAAL